MLFQQSTHGDACGVLALGFFGRLAFELSGRPSLGLPENTDQLGVRVVISMSKDGLVFVAASLTFFLVFFSDLHMGLEFVRVVDKF